MEEIRLCYSGIKITVQPRAFWKPNKFENQLLKITRTSLSCLQLCHSVKTACLSPGNITYLGIQIPFLFKELYDKNFTLLLHKIQDLKEWMGLNLLWFRSSALNKMNILPRILYLLQTIPITLPNSFFSTCKHACSAFLWKNATSRIMENPTHSFKNEWWSWFAESL